MSLEPDPVISVVMPAHLGAAWIGAGLESLAAQTLPWPSFEVVVVRNGPADGTTEIVDDFAAAHPGFRLTRLESEVADVARARNLGVQHARGPYVTFVDCDDALSPRALEALLGAAGPDRISMVTVATFDDGRPFETATHRHPWQRRLDEVVARHGGDPAGIDSWDLLAGLPITGGKLVSTAHARRHLFDPELRGVGEDLDFWFRILCHERTQIVLADVAPATTYLYRLTANSLTRSGQRWEHVAAALRAVAKNDALPARTERERSALDEVVYSPIGRVREYLTLHHRERSRVVEEATARGIRDSRLWAALWATVNEFLAPQVLALVDQHDTAYDTRFLVPWLSRHQLLADVVGHRRRDATGHLELRDLEPYVAERSEAEAAGTWDDAGVLAEASLAAFDGRSGTGYDVVFSSSTDYAPHLAAAAVLLLHPEIRWVAEFPPDGAASTAPAPMPGDDRLLSLLRAAFSQMGDPTDLGGLDARRLARTVASRMADVVL